MKYILIIVNCAYKAIGKFFDRANLFHFILLFLAEIVYVYYIFYFKRDMQTFHLILYVSMKFINEHSVCVYEYSVVLKKIITLTIYHFKYFKLVKMKLLLNAK